MPGERSKDRITRQAIEAGAHHYVAIHSGETTEAEVAACASWRAASPVNESVWQQMQSVDAMFDGLPATGKQALKAIYARRDRQRRRRLLIATMALIIGAGLALLLSLTRWIGAAL